MSRIIKDIFILFAITLVAGLALGAVFNLTKGARDDQEKKTLNEAYEKVMPGVESTEKVKVDLKEMNAHIAKEVKAKESEMDYKPYNEFKANITDVLKAKDKDNKDLGYIITVTDEEAYNGSLTMTVGVDMNGSVKGISFLDINETPGLGMKAKDEEFLKQYNGKDADFFTYVKENAEDKSEVDAISSATITTNAVTHGVDACLICANHLGGDSHE
ncbi:MAG: FMN-binding protein [Eubacterium sp.]|nr:FMN-binding protein [Eubacterium sp.]